MSSRPGSPYPPSNMGSHDFKITSINLITMKFAIPTSSYRPFSDIWDARIQNIWKRTIRRRIAIFIMIRRMEVGLKSRNTTSGVRSTGGDGVNFFLENSKNYLWELKRRISIANFIVIRLMEVISKSGNQRLKEDEENPVLRPWLFTLKFF